MNIVTAIHILDPDTGERVATFTHAGGWTSGRGSWTEIPMVAHPSDPDPLMSYADALRYEGHKVEVEEGEDEGIEGRVF